MTGISPDGGSTIDDDDEEEPESLITTGLCRQLLLKQRAMLRKKKVSQQLPLFRNIVFLSKLLGLNEADRAVLTFATGLYILPLFRDAIGTHRQSTSIPSFCKLMAALTGIDE